jgi:teichuronic acid biosynthesis glycosyltransferase TuaG
MSQKKVSIIMPTLNASSSIYKILNSVINQSYKHWEVIVIDGYSKDNTVEIIKKLF